MDLAAVATFSTAAVAVMVAVLGNLAANRRQQAEWDRRVQEKKEEMEAFRKRAVAGMVDELRVASGRLKHISSLLQGETNVRAIPRDLEACFIKRPIFDGILDRVLDLPEVAVQAVAKFESELQHAIATAEANLETISSSKVDRRFDGEVREAVRWAISGAQICDRYIGVLEGNSDLLIDDVVFGQVRDI